MKCENFYKIGYSTSPKSRLEGMQTSCPFKISLLWSQKCPNYKQIECLLHDKYKDKRTKGEWFELNSEDIKFITEL